jgi:elongation factor P
MHSASDLRKGLKVEIDGVPYVITDFSFNKPGKGQAIYTCKLKNMINGSTLTRSYRANDKLDKPVLHEKKLTFSYKEDETFVFMDENYEQVHISSEVLGEGRNFMVEEIVVEVLYHNDLPIEVVLPNFVEKPVIETEPGARGNTATNVLKPGKLDTGYIIQIPLFVNQGDVIRIDTRNGAYVQIVKKASS